jgi:hypothetical protein
MFHRSPFTLLALASLFACGSATAQPLGDRDLEQWTQIAVAWKVQPQWDVKGFEEFRFNDNVSQYQEILLSAGAAYSPVRWVSFGSGYLYLRTDQKPGALKHENRIYNEATFKAPAFHGFQLSDRVRAELRWLQRSYVDTFTQRYRNRLIVQRPVAIHQRTYTPYVMWEKFYDTTIDQWNRTRYYAGVTAPVANPASVQVYYVFQHDKYSLPSYRNTIGVSLLFRFRGAHAEHPHE